MNVPRYSSLWKLRHLIAEEFSIEGLSFEMHLGPSPHYKETNFEKEEDFSMALITISKEGPPSIYIVSTKTKYPHVETIETFLKMFAESKGEELYESLAIENEAKEAIELLNKLPPIKKLS